MADDAALAKVLAGSEYVPPRLLKARQTPPDDVEFAKRLAGFKDDWNTAPTWKRALMAIPALPFAMGEGAVKSVGSGLAWGARAAGGVNAAGERLDLSNIKNTPEADTDAGVGLAMTLALGGLAAPPMKNAAGMGIRAYHGSPHDFDKFEWSPKTRGTGEGAQAYGDGLYFAENEGVARAYRDALSGRIDVQPVSIDGVKYNPPSDQHQRVAAIIAKDGRRNAMGTLRSLRDQGVLLPEQEAVWNEVLAATKGKEVAPLQGGRVYEVDINANPEQFLDWDKPLFSQSPEVRQRLEKVLGPMPEDGVMSTPWNNTVNAAIRKPEVIDPDYYHTPAKDYVPASGKAEEKLREAGIPGIKFLDQGSRTPLDAADLQGRIADLDRQIAGAQKTAAGIPENMRGEYQSHIDGLSRERAAIQKKLEPTHNYVVFSDEIVKIIRKYGLAGALAIPAVKEFLSSQELDPAL